MASSVQEPHVVLDELLQLLQCPVCLQRMLSPIEQCHNGHCICTDCRKKLQACPSCLVAFTGIRTRLVEDIAGKILFPCENREAGCAVGLLHTEIKSHRDYCPFRKYRCLAGEGKTGCKWVGRRDNILDHVKGEHGDLWWMTLSNKASKKQTSKHNISSLAYQLIQAHGEIFWQLEIVDVGMREFSWFVQYIGPKENAPKYKCQYVFTSPDGKCKLTFTCETYSDLVEMHDIACTENCVNLTFSQARAYITKNNSLKYKLKILKSE